MKDDFTLWFNTTVHYGAGKLSELGSLLRSFNASKILIVTDRGIVASGIAEEMHRCNNVGTYSLFALRWCRAESDDGFCGEGSDASQNMNPLMPSWLLAAAVP